MNNCKCHDPEFILELIYGEEMGKRLGSWLNERLKSFSCDSSKKSSLNEKDSILITYGDQFQKTGQKPLQTLKDFSKQYLKDVISAVHILPFYPYTSDDGFSVVDYRKVNPDWGDWKHVNHLGQDFDLMFDAVINHISISSDWFQGFLSDESQYQDYFIDLPEDTDLSQVVRPRTSPLLTRFDTQGEPKWVWTTFSSDQVDLNYESPDLMKEIIDIFLLYVENGARFIRLDAIAYLWKELGTDCIHLPQTHLVVKFFNALLQKAAPHVKLITETNVPHEENVSYFGNGYNEAHLVYNFALPPLTLYTFQNENAEILSDWASSLTLPSTEVTFFNFLASHDGIGVNPARGILPESEILKMAEKIKSHGGLVSSKTNADGSQSPYELNISFFDALSDPQSKEPLALQAKRFLASQAILLSVIGVPGIYVHSLLGSRNWTEGVKQTKHNRTINRQKFDFEQLTDDLNDAGSLQGLVFKSYAALLKSRAGSSAFHPHGAQMVVNLGSQIFALLRIAPDGRKVALCLQNVTSKKQQIVVDPALLGLSSGVWQDMLTGLKLDLSAKTTMNLDVYQTLWIEPVS
ncbi:MAG: sugar phosphorylase [Anaerolineaceae bacterium]|nr:sugar phosphorylase [Anaerolineaceae bacterium]